MKSEFIVAITIALANVTGFSQNLLDSTGNIGVGTLSPNRDIHIYEEAPEPALIRYENINSENGGLITGLTYDNGAIFRLREEKPMRFFTSNMERMRINADGKIGIGTGGPVSPLHLELNLGLDPNGFRISYFAPGIGEPLVNTELMRIGGVGEPDFLVTRNGIGMNTSSIFGDVGLHLKDRYFLIDGENSSILFDKNTDNEYGQWGIEYLNTEAGINGLNFWKPWDSDDGSGGNGFGNHFLFLSDNGNVSIGTDDSKGYKFAVNGNMIAEEIVVKLNGDWPDFVFSNKFNLMPLSEVASYIDENGHLPNVPSAKEVSEGGINLGDMDAILLQKIEELTLYMIQLEKDNQELKEKVDELSH